ncbi:extracellular solute-binding protein [Gemmiger sp.]|uniref:extracellular solute-binding protein n=1 Tax=Gemmiger sp. TaxID=2049027 RepID=UPI003F0A0DB7
MKKSNKVLALLTAVSLSAGLLAGCGGSASSASSSAADSSTAADSANAATEEFSYPMSGKELTYWCELNTNVSANYTNMGDTPFGQGLMERTGVTITYLHPPTGQLNEQFNLILADGDLPDIMEYTWQSYPGGPQKAIEDGNILALNDIIDQYCPNLKAYLEAHPDVDRQCKTDEGNYYMFPFVRGDDSLRVSTGLMIRQDWLNDLGLEMPTTIDEWHDVLTAFKTEKGATAPFAFEYTTPSLRNNWPFMSAYNTTAEFYVGDDGKIHYGPAEENYKEFLTTMNQWYKEGLLDPDMPTAQLDQVSAKMTSGASGASLGWIGSRMGVWTTAAKETDPNYDLEAAPVPTLNKGETAKMGPMDNVVVNNGGAAITTRCKDIEAAARLLDWAYSDEGHMYYNFGTEGESYTMENGEPVYTDLILNNPDGLPIAQAMSGYIRGNYNGPFVQDVRYAQQYYTMDCQKKAQATWTVPEASEHVLPPITPSSGESEEFSAIMNEINTYRDEMTLKFILGTESLDNFDKFVDTMNQMNLKRAIEIENSALDRYNAR